MGKLWSLLFLAVPVLGTGIFVAAANDWWPIRGHWFPELVVQDQTVDHLFYFILYLTGAVFIATGLVLFWFLWRYDAETNQDEAIYSHGSHVLEVVWSIVPAVVLLFIAIYQMDAWAGAKMRRPTLADGTPRPALARVTGRQFEWRIQYPGADGVLDTADDIHLVNELHVPIDEDVVLEIDTIDVLHSFFLPHFRVKQDVVPGMKQYVWFHAIQGGSYDIVCAELCGWGHYKMKGEVTVESREQFDRWIADSYAEQERSQFSLPEDQ